MKDNPYKKIISVLISAILIINIMPFYHVKADNPTPTYMNMTIDEVLYIGHNTSNWNQFLKLIYGNDVRFVCVHNNNDRYYFYAVSLSSIGIKYADSQSMNPTFGSYTYDSSSYNYNSTRYYYIGWNFDSAFTVNSDIPIVPKNKSPEVVNAIDYTFGEYAVDPAPPAPPIQAGVLSFNYYTDFASNQQNTIGALQSNRDTITWDYDTTDSNIPGIDLKVDIRAVPSKYYASTENALESLTWSDLSLDINYSADLGSYQMNWNNRKVSYTWGEVVDKVKLVSNLPDYYNDLVNSWNFKFIKLNDLWYWTGWVYQIRLNTFSGDYTGEWQTIYQISSAPPEGSSQTINYYVTNGTGVTQPIYQTIQNVNNQNNVTNNTWYVNGSPYSIDNDTGQNWWETLLQFISDLVSSVLSFLGSIFDSVITGVLELVNNLGINFLEVFSNLINRIVELFGNIDLTGQNYLIPEEYTENLNTFNIWTTGLFNVFINSGLGLLVFIPFILLIVRLFI